MIWPFKRKPKQLPPLPEGALAALRAMTDDELIWAADYIAEHGDTDHAVIRRLVNHKRGYREKVPTP